MMRDRDSIAELRDEQRNWVDEEWLRLYRTRELELAKPRQYARPFPWAAFCVFVTVFLAGVLVGWVIL